MGTSLSCAQAGRTVAVTLAVSLAVRLGISTSNEVRLDSAISEVTWERTDITDDLASARASRWRARVASLFCPLCT